MSEVKKISLKLINAEKSEKPMTIRGDNNEGRAARKRLLQIGKSTHCPASDWSGIMRFAIEFTARSLTKSTEFASAEGDQLSKREMKAILAAYSDEEQSTEAGRERMATDIKTSSIDASLARRDVIVPSKKFDYSEMLQSSQEISLVFNDMYNWLGNHSHLQILEDRIRANQRKTNIYLIHPQSPVLDYVAAKSNKLRELSRTGENRQLYDIKRSLFRLLENVIDEVGDKTKIRGHQWMHAYSMVMNQAEAYVTPYLNKRVGNAGIIHVYREGAASDTAYMYDDLKSDLEDMIRYSTDIPNLNLVRFMQEHRELMNAELYPD